MNTFVPALDRLARAAVRSQLAAASDAELLRRFRADRDAAAFESLVDRHGPMILGLCKRLTRDEHLAEDAFQATFLTLSRKAGAIRRPESLPAWLFGIARRAALKARADSRRAQKLPATEMPGTTCHPLDRMSARELLDALDTELARLPLAQRSAVLLCTVEGKSVEETARRLGATTGSVRGWLQRGRNRLRDGLARRGLDLPAGLAILALVPRESIAESLAEATVRIGMSAVGISSSVAALTSTGMSLSMKLAGIVLLAASLAGIGSALMPVAALSPDDNPHTAKPVDSTPNLDAQPPAVRLDRFGDPLPEEALARFGTVRFRQGLGINAICYSPDEKTIAMVGQVGSLGLWDVATGKDLFQKQFMFDHGMEGKYYRPFSSCLAFSPDGKILAAARLSTIEFLNAQTGELIRKLSGHENTITALAFCPDGKTVISAGGEDKTIRFWDAATGQETAKLDQHADQVVAMALTNDGKLLASGGPDTIRLWDVKTRGLLKELQGSFDTLSFSPDGKKLVSTDGDKQSIIWDVAKGEPAHQLDDEHKAVQTAVFSPNGKWVAASCSDGAIRLYDPSTGKEVRRWETQSRCVPILAFSKDSTNIAASTVWDCVRFWDVETGKETRPLEGHRSKIDDVKLSADGKSLWGLGRADRQVIRWNIATANQAEVVPIPASCFVLEKGSVSPDGAFLAWGAASDKTIHVMDLKTRKDACEPLKTATDVFSVQFSPDGKVLAIGCNEGSFYVWNWKTERNPKPLKTPDKARVWPRLFTPDGKYLVTGLAWEGPDMLHVWDVATARKIRSFHGNNDSAGLDISPDGKWVVFPYGNIMVIDFETGKTVREIKVDLGNSQALAFSPDGSILAFGEDHLAPRSDVKLIEFTTGELIATLHGHHSGVNAFQFAPDGRTLYSGAGDSTILKWDATARHGKGPSTPNPAAAWEALAQEASKAYPARWDLVDAPKEAVDLLRKKIVPAKKLDPKVVRRMVDDLDSDDFQDRRRAAELLKSIGYSVEPFLREIVKTEKRVEVKQQLQKLIDGLGGDSLLRIQRAFQVLEAIGNDEAKRLLQELANGIPESMLTREAAAALKRLAK